MLAGLTRQKSHKDSKSCGAMKQSCECAKLDYQFWPTLLSDNGIVTKPSVSMECHVKKPARVFRSRLVLTTDPQASPCTNEIGLTAPTKLNVELPSFVIT